MDIKTAEKKRAILVSICEAVTYQVICNLTTPGKPKDHSFEELVQLVQAHRNNPLPSVTVQRFTFNTRAQKDSETVSHFVAELRQLSEHCQFDATLDDMLQDRLVCGVRDVKVQIQLLAEPNLTFKKAFELSQSAEAAEKNARELQASQKPKGASFVGYHQSPRSKGPAPPRPAKRYFGAQGRL